MRNSERAWKTLLETTTRKEIQRWKHRERISKPKRFQKRLRNPTPNPTSYQSAKNENWKLHANVDGSFNLVLLKNGCFERQQNEMRDTYEQLWNPICCMIVFGMSTAQKIVCCHWNACGLKLPGALMINPFCWLNLMWPTTTQIDAARSTSFNDKSTY